MEGHEVGVFHAMGRCEVHVELKRLIFHVTVFLDVRKFIHLGVVAVILFQLRISYSPVFLLIFSCFADLSFLT